MRRMLLSLSIFFFSSYYAGFSPDTVVITPQGFKPIGQLQKGSCVTSYDLAKKTVVQGIVTEHSAHMASYACRIVCDNDISCVVAPNQRLLAMPRRRDETTKTGDKQWVNAKELKKGDRLNCCDSAYATVLSVEVCSTEQYLCEITVEPYHTFCVTSRGIIVHNSPAIVISTTSVVIPVVVKAAGIVATIGTMLWHLLSKKKDGNKSSFMQDSSHSGGSSPSPKKPNDEEEFSRKHPHGRYEDATYHHKNSSGTKSPAPIDGQKALDNSLRIKDTKPHRIGISEDQFVVLRETSPGLFHGYVCEWEQLTDTMQKVLRKAQWATHNGKIICK